MAKKMGCWCPVEEEDGTIKKVIILLDIITIMLLVYIAFYIEDNWLLYMPMFLLVLGGLLLMINSTYRRK